MCIMFAIFILLATLGSTFAGYAGSPSNDVNGGSGYGFSGSYSGTGSDIPQPPIPNFDFGNIFNGHFRRQSPHSFAFAYSSLNAKVQAQSSITFVPYQYNRLQQQAEQLSRQSGGYAPGFSSYAQPPPVIGGRFGGDGSAIASASIGPQGGHQTAAVFPENPNAPNIFSRFAETSQGGGGGRGDGTYGVFTSSFSSSNNVDGKPQTFRTASTTINDNGKVTTYTVKNP